MASAAFKYAPYNRRARLESQTFQNASADEEAVEVGNTSARRRLTNYIRLIIEHWGVKNTLFLTLTLKRTRTVRLPRGKALYKGPNLSAAVVKQKDKKGDKTRQIVLTEPLNCKTAGIRLRKLLYALRKLGLKSYVYVMEPTNHGVPHVHVIFNAGADVKSGFDLIAYEAQQMDQKAMLHGDEHMMSLRGNQNALREVSSNTELQRWNDILEPLKGQCGFGRLGGFLPVIINADAVAHYLSKCEDSEKRRLLGKGSKGVRLVHTSRDLPPINPLKPASVEWGAAMEVFTTLCGLQDRRALRPLISTRWVFWVRELFFALDWISESLPMGDGWRERGVCPWLAKTVLKVMEIDDYLRSRLHRLAPCLNAYLEVAKDDGRSVTLGGFEPFRKVTSRNPPLLLLKPNSPAPSEDEVEKTVKRWQKDSAAARCCS